VFASGEKVEFNSEEYERRCACVVDLKVINEGDCEPSANDKRCATSSLV
jgi:hypothetical protein